jgi:hypothetical protein
LEPHDRQGFTKYGNHALTDRTTKIPALRACLRMARTRWCGRFILSGAVGGVLAGLLALCGLELAVALFDESYFASGLVAVAFATGVAILTCAAAGILAVAFAPDDAALARMGDRQFLLQERLTTALEAENRQASETFSGAALDPVRRALLADAERCAQRIDARQWFKLGPPRLAWAVPALTGVATLLSLLNPGALGRATVTSETGQLRNAAQLTSRQSAAAAADLRSIAEVVAKDAENASDPYLRAIARSLERLSTEVQRGAADRRAIATALYRLLQHARRAYPQDDSLPSRASGNVSATDRIQSALNDITGDRARETEPHDHDVSKTNTAKRMAAATRDAPLDPIPPQQRKTPGSTKPDPTTPSSLPPGWANLLDNLDDYERIEADPRAQVERAIAEQQRRLRGAGQSAGAAQDAGQGEGDRAGNGSPPLGNGAGVARDVPIADDMLLPDQPADGGRIRIEIPPDAVHADVALPPPGSVGGEWRHVQEEAIDRPAPTAEERKALGRFFTRSAEGNAP